MKEWTKKKKLELLDILEREILKAKEDGTNCFICEIAANNRYIKYPSIHLFEKIFPALHKYLYRNYMKNETRPSDASWCRKDYKNRLRCVIHIRNQLNK